MLDIIIQGDTIEVLKSIPDESVDLVFADPPFNIGKPYKDTRDNYREWCHDWIRECWRVLKDTGSFYLMTLTKHLEWKMPIMASYGIFVNLITWRNVSACHTKRQFWLEYQPIMFYAKTNEYIFNTYAETIDNGERRWGGYSTEFKGQMKDRWDDIPFVYAGSIAHPEAILEPVTNRKIHCAQMPEGLPKRAIMFSTNPDAVVLDPTIGSGTTAIAAMKTGRHYVGIELEQRYVDLCRDRIEKAKFEIAEEKRQLLMF